MSASVAPSGIRGLVFMRAQESNDDTKAITTLNC
jgi:hypothetical protein